jgi:hypothetical protein
VFAEDMVLTEPPVLRPGDTVRLQNGDRLDCGQGCYFDLEAGAHKCTVFT